MDVEGLLLGLTCRLCPEGVQVVPVVFLDFCCHQTIFIWLQYLFNRVNDIIKIIALQLQCVLLPWYLINNQKHEIHGNISMPHTTPFSTKNYISQEVELLPLGCAQVYCILSTIRMKLIIFTCLSIIESRILWWRSDRPKSQNKVKHCIDLSVWKSLLSVWTHWCFQHLSKPLGIILH